MVEPFPKKRLLDLDLLGKQLLIRADLNAPLVDGRVADDARLHAALPGIRAAHAAGAGVVLASHLGRPGGRIDPRLTLRPVADRLARLLGAPVRFDPTRASADQPPERVGSGATLLLENLRFHPGETANDPDFGARLAAWGDEYANDAFGTAHRAHASTVACARRFARAAGGPLLERELRVLGGALHAPRRPFVAVLGGAKISDKLAVVRSLLDRADAVLVGGAMAYTFLGAAGHATGRSLMDPERLDEASALLRRHASRLVLPTDHLAAPDPDHEGEATFFPATTTPAGWMGLDIGLETRRDFSTRLQRAATIIWNGPMGMFERRAFAGGTESVAAAVAKTAGQGATTIVGGGDSLAALRRLGTGDGVGHLSTGGGAMLTLLAGQSLPGVEALADA